MIVVDLALEDEWAVGVSLDPKRPEIVETIATVDATTFNHGRIPAQGRGTHFGLVLTSQGVGPHRLGSVLMHYLGGEAA